jgi:hypothetical protein
MMSLKTNVILTTIINPAKNSIGPLRSSPSCRPAGDWAKRWPDKLIIVMKRARDVIRKLLFIRIFLVFVGPVDTKCNKFW